MRKFPAAVFFALLSVAPLYAQRSEKAATAVSQESGVLIFQNGKTLQLQNVNVGDKLEVLSIVGVRVFEKRIESSNQQFVLDLPKGYYIVKIGTTVRKILVK
jgi:hypothetical protein